MLGITYFLILIPYLLADESVKFAAVLYRHGDRTPVKCYPTDPWKNQSYWPVRFGELTNVGKKQHYALGQWFRERYAHLVSDKFDPLEVYIRSTDVDRTLMSAQANLAGLYPPKGESIWDNELMWQPIPVHTNAETDDEILAMKKPCQAYKKEYDKVIHSPEYKKRLRNYQWLMDYLTANTGSEVKDYSHIDYLYGTLFIESLYNFTLPNWTQAVYPEKMREPASYSFTISTLTPTLARLKVGPLLKEITTRMQDAATSDKSLKLAIYSAHDDTVAAVLNALGMFERHCPPYTATVLMELVEDKDKNSLFVRISYRNSTGIVEPDVLKIPQCGELCPLERFLKLYENLLTVDWDYECGKKVSPVFGFSLFIGFGLLIILYAIAKIYTVQMSKRYQEAQYTTLDAETAAKVLESRKL